MKFPKNTPIRRKLRIIMMVTCGIALLASCVALFFFQLVLFRQGFERDLLALSKIISNNATAAVTFKDSESAVEILASLVAKPQIKAATILLQDGSVLARFGQQTAPAGQVGHRTDEAAFYFDQGQLLYINPIVLDKKQIGTLLLYSDYASEFHRLLQLHGLILGGVLAASILIAFAVSSSLERLITQPILGLAETSRLIAEGKDYSVRATKFDNDEVGRLTDAFNQMLSQIQAQDRQLLSARERLEKQVQMLRLEIQERKRAESQLEELHRQLLDASRKAGMAEVATGVLHNIGNVLNSVNVSTTLLLESIQRSKLPNLHKAVGLLGEQGAHVGEFLTRDPRGIVLPGYLGEISQHLLQEKEALQREIDLLAKNIQHIKDIVAMQQAYAKVGGMVEALSIEHLVEDAIQMNIDALGRHSIQILRDYQEAPQVLGDKHKILQILVNLIQNAKHALTESPGINPRLLTLKISSNTHDRVQITISDNGVGIAPENLTRIFAHGFTTRPDGHGFGLHIGAIAAREMGGSLTAHSEGVEKGATFILEIPVAKPAYDSANQPTV